MNSKSNIYRADIDDLLALIKNKQLIIFGAGKIGVSLVNALASLGIEPAYVWDNNAEAVSSNVPFSVTKPSELEDKSDVLIVVTIFAQNVAKEISDQLRAKGYDNVISDRDSVNSLLYLSCSKQVENKTFNLDISKCHKCPASKDMDKRCDIYDEHISGKVISEIADQKHQSTVIIPSMGLLVHNDCNLTCNGCNHLRDLYKPSDNLHIPASDTLHYLQKVIDAVDFIEKVVIVGGEAFIHKEIYEIVERVLEMPKIGIIQVITNGIQMPKNKAIFNLLSDPRVVVEVSGYEESIPVKTQAKVGRFLDKLQEHNVSYQYMNNLQWFDFGGFESRGHSKEKLQDIYKKCCFVSNDLFNGELHKCSRSVFSKHLNKIPLYKNDFVDVKELSGKSLRSAIADFLSNTTVMACQHCGGTSTSTIPAGVQVIPLKEISNG